MASTSGEILSTVIMVVHHDPRILAPIRAHSRDRVYCWRLCVVALSVAHADVLRCTMTEAEWEHAERCTNPDCHDDEYNQDNCPSDCPSMILVKVPKGAPEPE